MRQFAQTTLIAVMILSGGFATAVAQSDYTAKGIIAEHCIECHRVPSFAEEAGNPSVVAPDFQAIADDDETYTTQRLVRFLRQPHFPMRRVWLSDSDIQRIVAFIEGLRAVRPKVD